MSDERKTSVKNNNNNDRVIMSNAIANIMSKKPEENLYNETINITNILIITCSLGFFYSTYVNVSVYLNSETYYIPDTFLGFLLPTMFFGKIFTETIKKAKYKDIYVYDVWSLLGIDIVTTFAWFIVRISTPETDTIFRMRFFILMFLAAGYIISSTIIFITIYLFKKCFTTSPENNVKTKNIKVKSCEESWVNVSSPKK